MVLEHWPGSARALGFAHPTNPFEATPLLSNIGDSHESLKASWLFDFPKSLTLICLTSLHVTDWNGLGSICDSHESLKASWLFDFPKSLTLICLTSLHVTDWNGLGSICNSLLFSLGYSPTVTPFW
ncbi:hypothetical protein HanPSC8_Chr13g0585411 [Helianthus annuus]|nr:hypothetical protein HanPSC8_Chr13g0585411 [Helianthus annuus]